jgi:hypothetical protein
MVAQGLASVQGASSRPEALTTRTAAAGRGVKERSAFEALPPTVTTMGPPTASGPGCTTIMSRWGLAAFAVPQAK